MQVSPFLWRAGFSPPPPLRIHSCLYENRHFWRYHLLKHDDSLLLLEHVVSVNILFKIM